MNKVKIEKIVKNVYHSDFLIWFAEQSSIYTWKISFYH